MAAAERTRLEDELQAVQAELQALNQRKRELLTKQREIELKIEEVENRNAAARSAVDWENGDFEWNAEVSETLRTVFRLEDFRELQRSAINLVLSGHDTVGIMSTGGGKSLTYQLPAVLPSRPGVVLVVQPLLSLVEDQLIQLRRLGIEAESLNANSSKEDVTRIQNAICDSRSPIRLLYVTPEKLAKSKRFMNKLEKCFTSGLLKLIAIDEVHCCSQWGNDFRPDYKFLGILKRQFPSVPILGLTATATVSVVDDVCSILQIQGCSILRSSFNRPNLHYEVRAKSEKGELVTQEIVQLLQNDFANQSGIIYCLSRKECEELSASLREKGVAAAFYHGDLDVDSRSKVHNRWLNGGYHVIVSTLAFGMGIDKPDVRFVIHHSVAKAVENYWQESGRAGRDGALARCILFYRLNDIFRQSTLNYTDQTRTNLYAMMAYATTFLCRRELIARHFGELYDAAWCDAACDVCVRGKERQTVEFDITPYFAKIFAILEAKSKAADQGRLTGNKLSELLAKQCPDVTREFLEMIVAHLLLTGGLREEFHFTPYSVISYLVPGFNRGAQLSSSMTIDAALLDACWTAGGPSAAKKIRKK